MSEKKKTKTKRTTKTTTNQNKNKNTQKVVVNINTTRTQPKKGTIQYSKGASYLGGTSGRAVNYPMVINNMMPTPIPMMMPNLESNKINSLENSIRNIHSDIQGIYGRLNPPTSEQVQRTIPYLPSQTRDIMTEASKTKTFDTPKWGDSSSNPSSGDPPPHGNDAQSMEFTYNPLTREATQTRLKSSFTHNTSPAQSMQETEDNINQAIVPFQPPINQYGVVDEPLTSVRASNNSVSMGVSQANPMSIQTVQNQDPQPLELEYPQQPLALPPIPLQTSLSSGIYNSSSIDEGSVKSSNGSVMYDSFASPPFRTQSVPTTVKVGSTQRTSSLPSNYIPTEVQGGDTEVVQPASSEETVEGTPPQQQAEAGPSNPKQAKKSAQEIKDILNDMKTLREIREIQKEKKGHQNNRANNISANLRALYFAEFGEDVRSMTDERMEKLEFRLRALMHKTNLGYKPQ